ncbi:MAG: OmpA family protein [Candidatus Accumulibacter sp.]|nr:OmpA family protein [Accumulibacter sp.]
MRNMLICATLILTACSSPPKPPVVDGANRQTINDPATIELLSRRASQVETPVHAQPIQVEPRLDAQPILLRYHFGFCKASLILTPMQQAELLSKAKNAKQIEIRGRTDGLRASAGDERIALARAISARSMLIDGGVPAERISINYASATDYTADNNTPDGRALNRRVEIELRGQWP